MPSSGKNQRKFFENNFANLTIFHRKVHSKWDKCGPPYIIGCGGNTRGFLNHMSYVKGVTHLTHTVSQLVVHYLHQITWSYGSCDKSQRILTFFILNNSRSVMIFFIFSDFSQSVLKRYLWNQLFFEFLTKSISLCFWAWLCNLEIFTFCISKIKPTRWTTYP